MADLKSREIRNAYDDLLTKGAGNTVEDGDGNAFDIFNRAFTAGGLVRLPSGLNFNASGGDTLSDYELGDWDVQYSTTGVAFDSVTYPSFKRSNYIKFGSLYVVYGRIATNDITKGSATGNVRISLPFVSATGTGQTSGGIVIVRKTGFINYPTLASIEDGGSHALVRKGTDIATQNFSVDDLDYTGTDKNNIQFFGIYS